MPDETFWGRFVVARRLGEYSGFRDGFDNEESTLPWPQQDDVLIRPHVEGESWIYPLERWVPDHLDRLKYFAMQYHEMAQEAVKSWIRTRDHKAENYIFVIAYLYRHAIELRLKATIVETSAFIRSDSTSRRKMLEGHSILGLWQRVIPELPQEVQGEMPLVNRLIIQLHGLDTYSDDFRYPFRIEKDNEFKTLLDGLQNASGENLVWVLEAMVNWLNGATESIERAREFDEEMRNTFESDVSDMD